MNNMRNSASIAALLTLITFALALKLIPPAKTLGKVSSSADPALLFNPLEHLLFHRFAASVSIVMNVTSKSQPVLYSELINLINSMSFTSCVNDTHEKSLRMLRDLFPPRLLPAYRLLFSRFPIFSAWMNTHATAMTTTWLMGPSNVTDLQLSEGSIMKESCLVIEKCRFLETAQCVHTCLHACKVPTQHFFKEEMGLSVTLRPNFTDFSCRFEFGVEPIALELDASVRAPCITLCPKTRHQKKTL